MLPIRPYRFCFFTDLKKNNFTQLLHGLIGRHFVGQFGDSGQQQGAVQNYGVYTAALPAAAELLHHPIEAGLSATAHTSHR